jgi:hypothetical protein
MILAATRGHWDLVSSNNSGRDQQDAEQDSPALFDHLHWSLPEVNLGARATYRKAKSLSIRLSIRFAEGRSLFGLTHQAAPPFKWS